MLTVYTETVKLSEPTRMCNCSERDTRMGSDTLIISFVIYIPEDGQMVGRNI